jgi:hypothetical protein
MLGDRFRLEPPVGEFFADERGERPLVERRKDWPPIRRWVHELAVAPQRRDHRVGETRGVPLRFFR